MVKINEALSELASPSQPKIDLSKLLLRISLLTLNAKVLLKLAYQESESNVKKAKYSSGALFEIERAFKLSLGLANTASSFHQDGPTSE